MLGVKLDPAPLVLSADPDYAALYEAVVDRAYEYHRKMNESG